MTPTLKVIKDLRFRMPQIRDQGSRPLCLAFAGSDFNSAQNNTTVPLSVEFLAYHAYQVDGHSNYSDGLTTNSIAVSLANVGQPTESTMPYCQSASSPQTPPSALGHRFYSHATHSSSFIHSIDSQLNADKPTVICIKLCRSFLNLSAPFMLDHVNGHVANHAIVVVGSALSNVSEKYYLIRNSWGPAWGDGGHCWLSESYIKTTAYALLEG